jgi:hypothetical protein
MHYDLPQAISNFVEDASTAGTDPQSEFWCDAPITWMRDDAYGNKVDGHATEIRSRWTPSHLYFLFVCPYQELHLKPNPVLDKPTGGLWNWDVAEAFIGTDFKNIRRYKEFELSPQGEWVDLDIDLNKPNDEDGWKWNSGLEVSARIDAAAHVWYGAMRIPYKAIDSRPAAAGNMLRINLFRCQGASPNRKYLAWQPPMRDSFHTPEKFGILELVK